MSRCQLADVHASAAVVIHWVRSMSTQQLKTVPLLWLRVQLER